MSPTNEARSVPPALDWPDAGLAAVVAAAAGAMVAPAAGLAALVAAGACVAGAPGPHAASKGIVSEPVNSLTKSRLEVIFVSFPVVP
jgi:hypothetical protein